MSFSAMQWASPLQIKGPPKAVLMCLAWHHNDATGRCDPAVGTIALHTGNSDKTVRRALAELAKIGAIVRVQRTGRPDQVDLQTLVTLTTPHGHSDHPVKTRGVVTLTRPPRSHSPDPLVTLTTELQRTTIATTKEEREEQRDVSRGTTDGDDRATLGLGAGIQPERAGDRGSGRVAGEQAAVAGEGPSEADAEGDGEARRAGDRAAVTWLHAIEGGLLNGQRTSAVLAQNARVEDLFGRPDAGQSGGAHSALERPSKRGRAHPTREDAEVAFERWNATAERVGLPVAQHLEDRRQNAIIARLKKDLDGLAGWDDMLSKIEGSSDWFRKEFRPGLDWILKPANLTKLMEGNYDRAEPQSGLSAVLAACREFGTERA